MHKTAIVGWIIIFLILSILMLVIYLESDQSTSTQDDNKSEESENNSEGNESGDPHWSVDSASSVDKDIYQCVKDNYGEPKVWGRYLGDIENVSQGLDGDEVDYLHEKDINILVIYNHFEDATGYDHGAEHAEKAIDYADNLEIPDGTVIFSDIEPKFPVDSAFMEGWYETLSDSSYKPGLYGVFDDDSKLMEAYNAIEKDRRKNTVIWTAHPQKEVTAKKNAPKYNPEGPDDAMVYGWQYEIDSETCDIDTNLFHEKIMDYVW